MIRNTLFLLLLGLSNVQLIQAQTQTDTEEIRTTLKNYMDGSSYNRPEQIKKAFYADAQLFLDKKGEEIYMISPKEYADVFGKRKAGVHNGRNATILAIEPIHEIAQAKVKIEIPSKNLIYIDIFILKKLQSGWKIISKAATLLPYE